MRIKVNYLIDNNVQLSSLVTGGKCQEEQFIYTEIDNIITNLFIKRHNYVIEDGELNLYLFYDKHSYNEYRTLKLKKSSGKLDKFFKITYRKNNKTSLTRSKLYRNLFFFDRFLSEDDIKSILEAKKIFSNRFLLQIISKRATHWLIYALIIVIGIQILIGSMNI